MKHRTNPGRQVAALRKIIGKSQSQFASMVGVSKHTIISVENGRNKLTPKLANRIQIATGANLLGDDYSAAVVPGKNYTRESFDGWREDFYRTDEAAAHKHFEHIKKWVELVFRAATKSGLGGNRDRLPAIFLSLVEWLDDTRKVFKLEKEIDDILEEETRHVGTSHAHIFQLRDDPEYQGQISKLLGISLPDLRSELKKHADDAAIYIQDESRNAWDPEGGRRMTACKTRKLMPKPKYWFED